MIGGGNDIYLGGFRQLVHNHDESKIVTVGVEVAVDDDGCMPYPMQDQATLLAAFGKVMDTGRLLNPNVQSKEERNNTAHSAKQQADTIGNFLTNGIPGVRKVCVEVRVGIPTDDYRPVILEYIVSINEIPFARNIRESGLLTVLDKLATRHPIFSDFNSDPDEDGELPRNEFSEALEQALFCGHKLKSRTDEPQVLVVSGTVVPAFGEALDFELDDPEDEIDLRSVARLIISQMLVRPGQIIRDYLITYRHLGPIRAVPDLSSIAQRSPSLDRWIDGMAAWDLLSSDADRKAQKSGQLINKVSSYLKDQDRLNLGYSLSVETVRDIPVNSVLSSILEKFVASPDDFDNESALRAAYAEVMARNTRSQLILTDLRRDVQVNPTDIGAGVSQVIPVLVSVLDTASKVTAIEQPELHLHPAVQCSLGDLFIRAVNNADERFFIIETHSEHLLLRLMRRIREASTGKEEATDLKVAPDSIALLFVETVDGRSHYRPITIGDRGKLKDEWPGGFFEERLKELF